MILENNAGQALPPTFLTGAAVPVSLRGQYLSDRKPRPAAHLSGGQAVGESGVVCAVSGNPPNEYAGLASPVGIRYTIPIGAGPSRTNFR